MCHRDGILDDCYDYGNDNDDADVFSNDKSDGSMDDDEKRQFFQLDQYGVRTGPLYRNKSPYGAASQAARRGHRLIFLYDPVMTRVYAYRGRLVPMTTLTSFAIKRNITHRAVLTSIGHRDAQSLSSAFQSSEEDDNDDDDDNE